GRQLVDGASDVVGAETELREERAHLARRELRDERLEGGRERHRAGEHRPGLVDLADEYARAEARGTGVRGEEPEQQLQKRRLARAVRSRDADAVARVDLE